MSMSYLGRTYQKWRRDRDSSSRTEEDLPLRIGLGLRLGQLPVATVQRRPIASPPSTPASIFNFPSPTKGGSLFGFPHRFSKIHKRENNGVGTIFLKLAPVDLNLNSRKRGREVDTSPNTSTEANNSTNRSGPGPSTSKSAMSPADQNKFTKRVKYLTEQDLSRLHHASRPLNFDNYHQDVPSGNEQMTSKSILEQMNQTEKRFFPDTTPVTSAPRRAHLFGSPRTGNTSTPLALAGGIRKRKGGDKGISMVEFDQEEVSEDPQSKSGKFCHCNECYQEAAGISNNVGSPINRSPPLMGFGVPMSRRMVTFGESSFLGEKSNLSTSMCDKGTETEMEISRPEIIIRKATQGTVITKEKYDYDRVKRLERFKRILGLEPKKTNDQVDTDVMDGADKTPQVNISNPNPPPTTTATVSSSSTPQVNISNPNPPPTTTTATFSSSSTQDTTTTNDQIGTDVMDRTVKTPPPVNILNPNPYPTPTTTTVTFSSSSTQDTTPTTTVTFSSSTRDATSTTTTASVSSSSTQDTTTTTTPSLNFGHTAVNNGGFNLGQAPAGSETQSTLQFGGAPQATIVPGGLTLTPQAVNTTSLGTSGFESSGGNVNAEPKIQATANLLGGSGSGITSSPAFGSSSVPTTNSNSVFGSVTQPAVTSSPFNFGNSQAQPQANNGGFNFGQTLPASQPALQFGGSQQTPVNTTSLGTSGFGSSGGGGNVSAEPKIQATANLLGGSGSSSGITSTPAFGSSSVPTTNSNSVFGSVTQPAVTSSPFNFGNSQAQPQATIGGFNFGQTVPASQPAFQFGGSQQAPALNTTSLGTPGFGSSGGNVNAEPKIQATANLFGGSGSSSGITSTPSFGSSSVPTTNSNSVFGSVTQPAVTSSPFNFGNSQAEPQANNGGFNFGQTVPTSQPAFPFGGSQQAPVNTTSLGTPGFGSSGGNVNAEPKIQATANLFGGSGSSSGITSTPSFGSSSVPTTNSNSVFGTVTQPAVTSSPFTFGNSQAQPQANNGGFNFRQTVPASQPAFQFGGSQQTPVNTTSLGTPGFGSSGGNVNAEPKIQATANLFGGSGSSSGITSTPSFGSPSVPTTNSNSVFGSVTQPAVTSSPFNFGNSQAQPQANNGGFNFGQTVPASQPAFQFGGSQPAPGVAAGFNFASQAANTIPVGSASPGNAMFSVGQASAQRRRPTRRFR